MAHFKVNPSSSDYVNWEKRLVLYYKKQIFEKECQLKMNLEMIKIEYQVRMDMMEKAALEREVKKTEVASCGKWGAGQGCGYAACSRASWGDNYLFPRGRYHNSAIALI